MRLFLSALAVILGGTFPALAVEPSFDCGQAGSPVEYTICGDPELRRLDAALGKLFKDRRAALSEPQKAAFVQEQRDWARARPQKCAIPASIDRPMTEPERWLWAPCLADVYRVRLAALGEPDVPPDDTAPQDRPGFIHPLCLVRAVGLPMEESGEDPLPAVPLAACNRGFRHVPVLADKENLSAAGLSDHSEEFQVTLLPLVPLPGGDDAVMMRARFADLPGDYSAVYRISRKNGQLVGRPLAGGGETCHGGIFGNVSVVNGKLRVARTIDARRFLGYGATAALPEAAVAGLDDCPTCCYGHAEFDVSLTGDGDPVFVSATVGHFPRESTVPQQQCLDRLATRPGGDLGSMHAFSAADLRRITARYLQDCAAAAPVAQPAAAALDCTRPASPLQHLLCGDRELRRLHDTLEGLVARRRGPLQAAPRAEFDREQQTWAAGHRDCGVPATGGKPGLRQTWEWAPCLAARYRARVTALGQPEPTPEPFKVIHPMCVMATAGGVTGKPEVVALADCNHGYSHMAAVQDGTLISLPGTDEGTPSIDYRRIAALPDGGSAVLLLYGAGDRQHSEVWNMMVAQGVMTGRKLIEGGDNCRGGIFNVTVNGDRLSVESNATPADLAGAAGLPDCPTCCYGTMTREYPAAGGNGVVVSATLAAAQAATALPGPNARQACLDRLAGRARPLALDAAALGDLRRRFARDCGPGP